MNKQTPLTVQQIDEKILELKQQLLDLGPWHPGSLSRQYQICGKPGCKCCIPQRPRPHGPYSKLTYVYHGKYTCRFVRAESVPEVSALVARFKTFRQLTDKWIALAIERAQAGPLKRTASRFKPENTAPLPRRTTRRGKNGR
jgi:hypothetical protein